MRREALRRNVMARVHGHVKLIVFNRLSPDKGIEYSRDHWRRLCKSRKAPAPIELVPSRIAWDEEEIDSWLAAKKQERDTKAEFDRAREHDTRDAAMTERERALDASSNRRMSFAREGDPPAPTSPPKSTE